MHWQSKIFYPISFALSWNDDQLSRSAFFKAVGSAHKNMCDKELNSKCVVRYFFGALFNIMKEDYYLAIIVNCYFHIHKNVKINHVKCLKSNMLKSTTLADFKSHNESRAQKKWKRALI